MKYYIGKIKSLKENQIFVFGSNTQGRHGKGSALFALKKFGAIYGQAEGLQGQSYAIITKDLTVPKSMQEKSVPQDKIISQIKKLYEFAESNKDKLFFVAYTGKGKNLNGYSPKEMASMFNSYSIPSNIVFEISFANLIHNENKLNL